MAFKSEPAFRARTRHRTKRPAPIHSKLVVLDERLAHVERLLKKLQKRLAEVTEAMSAGKPPYESQTRDDSPY